MPPVTQNAVNQLRATLAAKKARADGAMRDFKLRTLASGVSAPALAWQEVDAVATPVGPGAGGGRSR